tara:strand:- start:3236 stop:3433 length:198 start_codon:yes stop_codon:yes gene_type:complete
MKVLKFKNEDSSFEVEELKEFKELRFSMKLHEDDEVSERCYDMNADDLLDLINELKVKLDIINKY